MEPTTMTKFKSDFEADVYKGLTSQPKYLSSKYFYGGEGDLIFQKIMDLPEYYLTKTEFQILKDYKQEIGELFSDSSGFDLIELGAGDGKKTKVLLKHFQESGLDFKYLPVDISENVLLQLTESLKKEVPGLQVDPKPGTYAQVLGDFPLGNKKKVILFLGSNIGNLTVNDSIEFLKKIRSAMTPKDLLFVGFDQKKDPQTILDAYHDKSGVTESFNKNLRHRIHRELLADFEVYSFSHWPLYDPETVTMKSYLVSRKKQQIHLKALDLVVSFQPWETIQTDV